MPDTKTARALHAVSRGLGRLGRESAKTEDITLQQAEALQLIAERGAVSTSSLATTLGIEPSTASRNLAGLQRAGMVVRRRAAADGRQRDVHLTPRGKRMVDAVTADQSHAYSALLERIPRPERQLVLTALEVLARALDAEG